MPKMKTRDRILHTSLRLLNTEGETNVTAVDIANEMDISPGNLYYHFKGKDIIIDALYDQFEEEMRIVLQTPIQKPLSLEDNWFYFYVVLEEIYDFRFFYRNISDILIRYPHLQQRFETLLARKRKTVTAVLASLEAQDVLMMDDATQQFLSEQIVLVLTYALNFENIQNGDEDPKRLINNSVYNIMMLLVPYFGDDRAAFYDLLQSFYHEVTEAL